MVDVELFILDVDDPNHIFYVRRIRYGNQLSGQILAFFDDSAHPLQRFDNFRSLRHSETKDFFQEELDNPRLIKRVCQYLLVGKLDSFEGVLTRY